MDSHSGKYFQRWLMAFNNLAAARSEPNGKVSYYSLRTPNIFYRRDGTKFNLDARHGFLWSALVASANDLTKDTASTWVGVESLCQLAATTYNTFRLLLADLITVGLVRKSRRGLNQTNTIRIYLTPLAPDQEEPTEINDVLVSPEDIGFYRCSAAEERLNAPKETVLTEPPDFEILIEQLTDLFPDHPSWHGARRTKQLRRHLLELLLIAGDVRRAYTVIRHYLAPHTDAAAALRDRISKSEQLGAYLKSLFPEWMENYPEELPEVMIFDEYEGRS